MSIAAKELELPSQLITPETQAANFFHLYWDVAWYGVAFGSTLSFLAVFATRLGAASWQIGLLSAGPALVSVLFTLPAGRWLEKQPLGPAVSKTATWQRLGFVMLTPLPLLLPDGMKVWVVLTLVLLMAVPGTALAMGFNALLATTVPPEWRGHVVGRRNALLSATIMLTFLLCGWVLDSFSFEWGYATVFGLGALGGMMSTYHLFRIKVPPTPKKFEGRPLQDRARPGRGIGFGAGAASYRLGISTRLLLNWRPNKIGDFEHIARRYWLVMLAFFFFHFSQLAPAAIFPVFWVRELGLTDGQISWINAVYYVAMLIAAPLLGPLTRRFGNHHLTRVGALSLASYPLLVALSTEMTLLLLSSILIGLVWALLSGALVNRLLEIIPDDDRPPHLALYNLTLNVATLGGTMLGPLLGDLFGLREALLIVAGLRVLSGLAMARWG